MKEEVKFCPKCGVDAIERDRYGEEREKPIFRCEWICSACGFGFLVDRSLRALIASQMATEMRKMRPPSVKREKPKVDDEQLNTLRKYAEKIEMPYAIFRSASKPGKFKFCTLDGVCHGSLHFEKAMVLLRGFEIANKPNDKPLHLVV